MEHVIKKHEIKNQAETDQEILNSGAPDEVLERTANVEKTAVTWIYCTNHWYSCDWPQ